MPIFGCTVRGVGRFVIVAAVGLSAVGCCKTVCPIPDNASTRPTTRAMTPGSDDQSISLFDGKTLNNWKASDFGGDAESRAEEGQLIVGAGATLSGVTWKGPALPRIEYEISFDARKINGGDFFVGLTFPYKDSFASLILGGWGGGLVGISSVDNFDASENATSSNMGFERNKWYHVRLRATDKKIEAWVDDKQVIDLETEGKKIDIRVDIENAKPLGFTTYQTAAAYKNIVMKKLTDTVPKTPDRGR